MSSELQQPLMSQRLVSTTPDSLPPGIAERVLQFCTDRTDIDGAWLCTVETGAGERKLQLGIKLATSVRAPEDLGRKPLDLMRDLTVVRPSLLRELQLAVLADRAVGAWENCGVLVFRR